MLFRSAELTGALHDHDIIDILDNADCRAVAMRRRAYRTDICFRNVMADLAVSYAAAQIDDCFPEGDSFRFITPENM